MIKIITCTITKKNYIFFIFPNGEASKKRTGVRQFDLSDPAFYIAF